MPRLAGDAIDGTTMARRLSAPILALALVAAWLLLTAAPAAAACHIAGFVESDVTTSPDADVVSLTVELQGRVGTCAGTVDVATVDGTAVAGQDYESVSATLTFEQDDDRVETIEVPILADATPGTSFTVELSDPTGDITGTGSPATVTIGGDDAPTDADDADDGEEPEETEPDAAGEDDVDDVTDAEEADGDGGSLGIALAVLAVVVVGAGAFARLRGRG